MLGLGPYWELLRKHPLLPAFGVVTAGFSSFGQTYFIGIFSPAIEAEFELTHTAWGSIYLLGTLASAMILPWTGKAMDRISPLVYALLVWSSLALACVAFSMVTGPIGLVAGIFLLRQTGQGLMSHLALTTMVQSFDLARGRAIAISSLGFAIGEAFLPLLGVIVLAWIGWRWSYRAGALLVLLGMAPALWLLVRGKKNAELRPTLALDQTRSDLSKSGWTRGQVLRDTRFYLLLPGLLCPSIIMTAMFFHHLNLADLKGWSHQWITGNYLVFAMAATITSLIAGQLIDRFGAKQLMPVMVLPLAAGLLVIAGSNNLLAVIPYMALIGATAGIFHTAEAALWAELYGTAHIGSIRSLAASLSVFGSAIGPVLMGGLLDLGLAAEQVLLIFCGYCVGGSALLYVGLRSRRSATTNA